MKILIVEDEEVLLKVLREKFENEGFKIEIATDGEMVMDMVKKTRPDLVLLDLLLPKKLGLEVLKEMKADVEVKDVQVLVLSNLDNDQDIKAALSLGAVDYFVKTQHPLKEIVEKVKGHLLTPKAR